jgi:hypothetical protein
MNIMNTRRKIRVKPTARKCDNCGRQFYGHRHARYCCNACRQSAYRDRIAAGRPAADNPVPLQAAVEKFIQQVMAMGSRGAQAEAVDNPVPQIALR